jgi:hypothetical protein
VKDLGKLSFFLGIEVLPLQSRLLLSQRRYITDLLQKTNMLEAKPITSPTSSSHILSAYKGDPMVDPSLYRSTVGYLSLTQPDLAFAVSCVCQFMHRPTKLHWQAVKRILRYLNRTSSHGLLLKRTRSPIPEAFFDTTGLVALMDDARRVANVFSLVLTSSHGALVNSQPSLVHLLKPITNLSQHCGIIAMDTGFTS